MCVCFTHLNRPSVYLGFFICFYVCVCICMCVCMSIRVCVILCSLLTQKHTDLQSHKKALCGAQQPRSTKLQAVTPQLKAMKGICIFLLTSAYEWQKSR